MKKLIRILCVLLCAIMCVSMAACAATEIDEAGVENTDPTKNPSADATDPVEPDGEDEPDEGASCSTYEVTLFLGGWGTIIINDFDSEGKLVKTSVRENGEDEYSLTRTYMDHSYSDAGVLETTVIYNREHTDIYGFAHVYKKYTEIKWTSDESGRIVSGRAQNSVDLYGDIRITYHGDTNVPSTVEMKELGELDVAFIVKYDESGKKIYEQYEDDVKATFTYTDGVATKMRTQSLHNEEDVADWTIEYDGEGRIVNSTMVSVMEGEISYSYTYAEGSDDVIGFLYEAKKDGDSVENKVTIEYDSNGLVSSFTQLFWESDGEETDGPYKYFDRVERDGEGRVIALTCSRIYGDVEVSREEIVHEYDEKGNVTARDTYYLANKETNELEVSGGCVNTYKYDENGNCIENIYESFDASGDIMAKTQYKYEYDARLNRTMKETVRYDSKDLIISKSKDEYVYNQDSMLAKWVAYHYNESGEESDKTVFEYEYYDSLVEKKRIETQYNSSNAVSRQILYDYNEKGERILNTDILYQNGVKSASYVYRYTYNDNGDKIRVEEIFYDKNDAIKNRTVREYEYDEYGVEKKVVTSYYSASGALSERDVFEKVMLDRNNIHTTTDSKYDGEGNLLQKTVKEHIYEDEKLIQIVKTVYDGEGNVLEQTETKY